MAKYCLVKQGYVLYLDCMECEEKECKCISHKKKGINAHEISSNKSTGETATAGSK